MVETVVPDAPNRTPGIVIFVAILNFLAASFFWLLATLSVLAILFGNALGVYQLVTRQMSQMAPELNLTLGINLFFGILLVFSVIFGVFYILVGIGLLRGQRVFWYIQIALSIIGLFGFPVGTVINAVVLVFLFQTSVRDFFRV
jgi:hypothetical protein